VENELRLLALAKYTSSVFGQSHFRHGNAEDIISCAPLSRGGIYALMSFCLVDGEVLCGHIRRNRLVVNRIVRSIAWPIDHMW